MGGQRTGRPRSAAAHTAILRAARELIVESGYAKLSMDRVAVRAGVGKQTVYRRWPSKAAMVADAVFDQLSRTDPTLPQTTEDVDRDLRIWLHQQVKFQATPENAALVRALTAAAADNVADADALYQQLTGPLREELLARLRAAVGRGQLRANADLDAVVDAITAAVTFPLLVGSVGPSLARADGLIDVIMSGIRADGTP